MKHIKLINNEYCALAGIEITSIPDVSIVVEDSKSEGQYESMEYITKYKNEFAILFSEIYQSLKRGFNYTYQNQDASIELLWKSVPVTNQIFKAKIRLFIIIRAIASTHIEAESKTDSILNICITTLNSQKYAFVAIEDEIAAIYKDLSLLTSKAIVKEDKQANLQSQYLQQCYSYDKFPETQSDLSRLTSALIDTPNAAISFQLIPTIYSQTETGFLEQMCIMLDNITKGIQEQSGGNIKNTVAQKQAELYSYYEKNKSAAIYSFNLLLYAEPHQIQTLVAKTFGQINGNSTEHPANMIEIDVDDEDMDFVEYIFTLPWALNEVITEKHNYLSQLQGGAELRRLSSVITADEASELGRLPIGSKNLNAGFNVNYTKKDIKSFVKKVINTGDIIVGKIKKSNFDDKIGFSLSDLTKHMLIVGTPGSGKTTFSVGMLDQLWKKHGIPFLVIEPAKNEYRALIDSIPDIQIFTPGKDDISPYVINPFVPPKNVKLKSYKTVLMTAFAAGVTMTTPLDKIFEETVSNAYSDFGWLDGYTTDSDADVFNIQDFTKNFSETFESLGYVGEAKNIGRAGLVRLISLINLFDNYYSIPIEDFLNKPTIIELAAIENGDQKALIIALLLLNILSYVNVNFLGEGHLKNIVLLEEAHVLLDSNDSKGDGEANPAAIAKGLLKRMLAEIRSYGVGIVIADQSPEKVTSDIIKLTNIKLGFNLVEKTDKDIFAHSTNMPQAQQDRLTKLRPGEAFLFMNGLEEPEEVVAEDYRAKNKIRITISDDEVAAKSTYWRDKQEKLKPYPECRYIQYCEHCNFAMRNLASEISRRVFSKNFNQNSNNGDELKICYSTIEKQSIEALRGKQDLTKPLAGCIKLHFLRRVKYGTKIKVSDKLIADTLKKV